MTDFARSSASVLALNQSRSVSVADNTNNPFASFLGPPPFYSKGAFDPDGKRRTVAPDLPEAYVDQSIQIPAVVDELVMTKDNFYTQVICPIRFTDQMHWQFNKTIFDQMLPRNTPHKAPSRLLEHRKTSKQGKLIRHGLAYEMESGFMTTEEGRRHYAYTLNQLANAIVASLNMNVIYSLLNCTEYERRYEEEYGFKTSFDLKTKLEGEIYMWSIVQKEKYGLPKLDNRVHEIMQSYQARANTWIFPPTIKSYVNLVPPENTDYYLAGPRGPANLNDSSVPMYTLGGNAVYLCDLQDGILELGGQAKNPLARRREIGSYYTMFDSFKEESSKYYLEDYSSGNRAFKAYNETLDDWTVVGLKTAHANCKGIYDADGNVRTPDHNRRFSDLTDREDDMLIYLDDGGNWRSASLFGHLREEHFSVQSALNLTKTVVKKQASTSNYSPGEMEKILSDGMALAKRIGERDLEMSWMYNVFAQHVFNSRYTWDANFDTKLDDDAYREFVKDITFPSKRSTIPMRVIRGPAGGGLQLPKYNYVRGVTPAAGNVTAEGKSDMMDTMEKVKSTIAGGSVGGSLAGFANWDGFVALKSEMQSGPGSQPGYTQNGYLVSDCKIASDFVDFVSSLTATMQFLFQNEYFLDKNKASTAVENPSVEHVVTEHILGLTGFPVWFDVSAISVIMGEKANQPAAGQNPFRDDLDNTRAYVEKFLTDLDRPNIHLLASIAKELEHKLLPEAENKKRRTEIVTKLRILLYPIASHAGLPGQPDNDMTYLLDSSALSSHPYYLFTKEAFPLSDLLPYSVTYLSLAMRKITVEVISKLILTNDDLSRDDKIYILSDFLDRLNHQVGPGDQISEEYLIAVKGFLEAYKNSAGNTTKNAFVAALITAGIRDDQATNQILSENRSDTNRADRFLEVLNALVKILKRSKRAIEGYKKELYDALEMDERADADQNYSKRSKILHMMKLGNSEWAGPGPMTADELNSAIGKVPGKGSYVGGRFGEGMEEQFDDEIHRLLRPNNMPRFFRTPLVLSAKQVEKLAEKTKAGDASPYQLIHIRVSDPSNVDSTVDVTRMKSLVDRIKRVNANGSTTFGDQDATNFIREPVQLFYPENIQLRDAALASVPIRLSRTVPASRKRRRPTAGEYGGDPFKRRRGGGKYGPGGSGGVSWLPEEFREESEEHRRLGRNEDEDGSGSEEGGMDPYGEFEEVDVSSLKQRMGVETDVDESITANVVQLMIKLGNQTNSWLQKIIGKVFYTSRLNKATLDKFIANDILFPFGFLVFQPYKRYVMFCGIKLWAGAETGVTYIGHSSLMIQNDAATKVHFGHFTAYDDTVILNEKDVFVAYDIFSNGTLGGADFVPIDLDSFNPRENETGHGSVIYVLSPYEEYERLDPAIDITGKFEMAKRTVMTDAHRITQRTGYNQAWRTNTVWKFTDLGDSVTSEVHYDDLGQAQFTNTVCMRGQQFNYSLASRDYTSKVKNAGHWGEEAPGSAECRRGGLRTLIDRTISLTS